MIYIGNFRNIQDNLYTVEFRTEVESEKRAFSPHSVTIDDKITFSLNRKGEYVFALPDLDYVNLHEYSSDIQILQQDGTIFTVIAHEDNQTITFEGDENYFDMINITQYNTKFITLAFEEPVTVNYTGDDSDIYKCAKYSNMVVKVINDRLYDDLFSIRSNDVRATLYKDGNIEWQGYLTPNVYSQDYAYNKNELELECVDSLAVMQYEPYKEKGNVECEAKSFKSLLDGILKQRFDNIYFPLTFKSGKIKSKGELPNGYTRLEYIRTDGKAYIDTGYSPYLYTSIKGSFRADYRYISQSLATFNDESDYFYGIKDGKSVFSGGIYRKKLDSSQITADIKNYVGWRGWDFMRRYEKRFLTEAPFYYRQRSIYRSDGVSGMLKNGWDKNRNEYTVENIGFDHQNLEPIYRDYYDRTRLSEDTFTDFKELSVMVDDNNFEYLDAQFITGKQKIGDYETNFFYATHYTIDNGSIVHNEVQQYSFQDTLLLFGVKDRTAIINSTPNTDCKYFQIYNYYPSEGNVLERNFIPCIQQSNGEVGMYDTVTQTFFGNVSPEGSFIAGAVVDESEVQELSDTEFDNYISLDNLAVSDKTWYNDSNKTWSMSKKVFENIVSYLGLTAIAKGRNLYFIDYEHLNVDSKYMILNTHLTDTGEITNLFEIIEYEGSADDGTTVSIASPYSEIKIGVNTDDMENTTDKIFKVGKSVVPKHTYKGTDSIYVNPTQYAILWEEEVIKSQYVNGIIRSHNDGVQTAESAEEYFRTFYELNPSANPQENIESDEAIGYIAKSSSIQYEEGSITSRIPSVLSKDDNSETIKIIPSRNREFNGARLLTIDVIDKDYVIPSNSFLVVDFNIEFSEKKNYIPQSPKYQYSVPSTAFTVPLEICYGDYYYTSRGWKTLEEITHMGYDRFISIPLDIEESTSDMYGKSYNVTNTVEYDMGLDSKGFIIPLIVSDTDVNNPSKLTVSFIDFANPGYDGNTDTKLAQAYFIKDLNIQIQPSLKSEKTDDDDNDDYEEVIDRSYVEDYDIPDFKIYSYNNKKAAYNTVYAYVDGGLYLLNFVYDEDLGITGNFEEFAIRKRIIQYSCPRKKLSQSLFGLFNPWTKFRNERIYGDINFIIDGESIDYRAGITTLNLVEKR